MKFNFFMSSISIHLFILNFENSKEKCWSYFGNFEMNAIYV